MDDKRIGIHADGDNPAVWPEVDVTGARYSKPATTHKLDAAHFVVLPAGFNQWDLLDELKRSLNPAPVAPTAPEPEVPAAGTSDEVAGDDTGSGRSRNRR